MKLSISNIAWEAKNDKIVYEYMKQYDFSSVEIAPTRWVQEQPYEYVSQAVRIAGNLSKQYGFQVSSMQSIWFGRQEKIFSSIEERKTLLDYTKKAIDYASAIGCKNLVFGCPRNRNIEVDLGLSADAIDMIAVPFFKELGDYAAAKGTVIGMEANPTIYNTNYVNTTEEAIALIEKVNSEGFLLNLDIGTVIQNKEDISALIGKVSLINHVHVSEPGLKLIEKRELHNQLRDILCSEHYEGFVSIEMGKQDDLEKIEAVMQYVTEIFG